MTWQEALPKIVRDKRYNAPKTLSERKKMFEEFKAELAEQEQLKNSIQEKEMISSYQSLLEDNASSLAYNSDFESAEVLFENDLRSKDFVDMNLKRKVFYEFIDNLKEADRLKKRQERQKCVDDLKSLILESCGNDLKHSWKTIKQKIKDCTSFQNISSILSDHEQQRTFNELLDDLETKETLEKEKRRKENRKQMEGFRSLLQEQLKNPKLQFYTGMHWKEFYPFIEEDPRYIEIRTISESDE